MNCRGCGEVLDPTEEQVNSAVNEVLQTSLSDAVDHGGVCPLCGHSKYVPYSHRRTVQLAMLITCLVFCVSLWLHSRWQQGTQRVAAAADAVARMSVNADVVRLLGKPIAMQPGVQGDVKQDETGWKEASLTIPVRGPGGDAVAHVAGGKLDGPWVFTTFEVVIEKQHKKVDLVSGRVVEYDPNAYVDIHTMSAATPEYVNMAAAAPRMSGNFPCVFEALGSAAGTPQLGDCAMPTVQGGPVERYEADLRYGHFVMRDTDLYLNDVFQVPLTRTYNSRDWLAPNPVHAFGRNSNHPYDIAPMGTRNPYTYQVIGLEDGDLLYFDRISKGSGYADAVYQHTETATRFYKAITRWNGSGWTTQFSDGSEIRFPESYSAKNMAQGAPIEMRNAQGDRLELLRDPQRNLKEIRTPHGHWIRFTYDNLDRITRADDDAGNWARYEYNADGMLTSAVLSSAKERHYQYKGALMTEIDDESGKVLLHNWYDDGELIRQQFGNGDVYSYSYSGSSSGTYFVKAQVTLPNQSIKELSLSDSVPDDVKNPHH